MRAILTLFFLTFVSLLPNLSFALTFDSDIPPAVKDQFLKDLAFAYQIQGSGQSPLHQEIFGTVSGESYKKFFETRIFSVGLDDCGGPPAAACVKAYIASDKMWLTPSFVSNSIPQIARILMMYHESRHTEVRNNNWSHASCPVPFLDKDGKDIVGIVSGMRLEGLDACDATVYGAYGSSTIMVKNIAKYCTNCNEKTKMDAEIWAEDGAKRIIDPKAAAQLAADFKK